MSEPEPEPEPETDGDGDGDAEEIAQKLLEAIGSHTPKAARKILAAANVAGVECLSIRGPGSDGHPGYPVLTLASANGGVEVVELLLGQDNSAMYLEFTGGGKARTALHKAATGTFPKPGCVEIVELLCRAGANKHATTDDKYQATPYTDARYEGQVETAIRLVELGADHTFRTPHVFERTLNEKGARRSADDKLAWTDEFESRVQTAIERVTAKSILAEYPDGPCRERERRVQAKQQRERVLRDAPMTPGTRLEIHGRAGTYERFKKNKVGANEYFVRFDDDSAKSIPVVFKKLEDSTWDIVPGAHGEMEVTAATAPAAPAPVPAAPAEPEPEPAPNLGLPPAGAAPVPGPQITVMDLLTKAKLTQYAAGIEKAEYVHVSDLLDADGEELQALIVSVKMTAPAAKRFHKAIEALRAAMPVSVAGTGIALALPLSMRTFASSNFKVWYDRTPLPTGPLELGYALSALLQGYCKAEGLNWSVEGQPFFIELQAEAMENSDELAKADQIPVAALRMWTSALSLSGREFCYMMNYAARLDLPHLVEPLAVLSRAINKNCVMERGPTAMTTVRKHPVNNVCFRGGGFLDDHRDFFTPGQKFRQPAFVATSFSRGVAEHFIQMRGGTDCVLWTIRIDPERLCRHVNLVTKTNVEGEQEYLFACYSVFTVLSTTWNIGNIDQPHTIELLAAVDNKEEPEDLPLAPWS